MLPLNKVMIQDNSLNESVLSVNEQIFNQKKELEDSLKYASYIQSAILPDMRIFQKEFPESFIYFRPKDLVSGDFYWFRKRKNIMAIAAADSTGHGVPGAFMSILGITLLNDIFNNHCLPTANGFLNLLREHIMKSLHQTGEGTEQKDGMDIALCIIDFESNTMQYSGAFNPLYLFRENELMEIKADRMPIGINIIEERSFTNHTVELKKNDTIYLFTDGYSDQFGGPQEKKFKYKRFKNLLLDLHTRPIDSQAGILEDTFNSWKDNREQIDDVLVMGFKYLHD